MNNCARSAWLELDGRTIALEDEDAGYFCTSLDLGYPDVREVTANRPDAHGTDDRTRYFGGRTVTAKVTAIAGAGAVIDQVAAAFAPFMLPAARPTLHYVLDRPGSPERVMVLRAKGYGWPIEGAAKREILLQWVAPDPVVRDPVVRQATAFAGSAQGTGGRGYDLTFNRLYPPGGGSPTVGRVESAGELVIGPLLRIYGPATAGRVDFSIYGGQISTARVGFVASFTIDAGHFVEVDTAAKTALVDGDPTRGALAQLDWLNLVWPVIAPLPGFAIMTMTGGSTSGVTQARALWQDAYLT